MTFSLSCNAMEVLYLIGIKSAPSAFGVSQHTEEGERWSKSKIAETLGVKMFEGWQESKRARLASAMRSEAPCICPLASACSRSRGPFRELQRQQHTILYIEGEPAERVYLVKRGSVSLHRASSESKGIGLSHSLQGANTLVGAEAFVAASYQSSARAETPLMLCSARREQVQEWIQDDPAAARTILESILKAQCNDLLSHLPVDGTATERVALWLLRRGDQLEPCTAPRKVIADILRMRPETLSRALRSLADRGYIETGRRHVLLVDPDGLRSILTH